ncbi:MAG: hypothetical protein ABII74_10365 [Elusimicrobiota bacterium]
MLKKKKSGHKSRLGGNRRGIGIYELFTCSDDVYSQAVRAINENKLSHFYQLLDLEFSIAEGNKDYCLLTEVIKMEEKRMNDKRHEEREDVHIPAICNLLISGLENFPRKFAIYIKNITSNGGKLELPMYWQCPNCPHCSISSQGRKCKVEKCIFDWEKVFNQQKPTLLQLEGNIFDLQHLVKTFAKIVWINNKEKSGDKKFEVGFYFLKKPAKVNT